MCHRARCVRSRRLTCREAVTALVAVRVVRSVPRGYNGGNRDSGADDRIQRRIANMTTLYGYAPDRALDGVVLLNVVESRISELWKYRSWYRQNRWADWPDIRSQQVSELRALVKLARLARQIAAAPPTEVTYELWTEAEKAYGR